MNEGVGLGFVIIEYWYFMARRGGFSYLVCESTTETTLLNQSALSCQHERNDEARMINDERMTNALAMEGGPLRRLTTVPGFASERGLAELAPRFNCRPLLKEGTREFSITSPFNLSSRPLMRSRPRPWGCPGRSCRCWRG